MTDYHTLVHRGKQSLGRITAVYTFDGITLCGIAVECRVVVQISEVILGIYAEALLCRIIEQITVAVLSSADLFKVRMIRNSKADKSAFSEADKTEVDISYSVFGEIIVHLLDLIGICKGFRNLFNERKNSCIGINFTERRNIERDIALFRQAGDLAGSFEIFSVCLSHSDIAALIELCSLAIRLILGIVELNDADRIRAGILTL